MNKQYPKHKYIKMKMDNHLNSIFPKKSIQQIFFRKYLFFGQEYNHNNINDK